MPANFFAIDSKVSMLCIEEIAGRSGAVVVAQGWPERINSLQFLPG
jgi:hypothetical protein